MQRRDLVKESVAPLVEATQVLRQRLVDEGRVDAGDCGCRGGRADLLEEIEQTPGVPVGQPDQARARIVVEGEFGQGLPAGAFEELAQLVGRERLQHIHRSP